MSDLVWIVIGKVAVLAVSVFLAGMCIAVPFIEHDLNRLERFVSGLDERVKELEER